MTIKSTFEECLLIGTNAMSTLTSSLEDEKFTEQLEAAVNLIHEINGRLVISGMGKSGIIGKKVSCYICIDWYSISFSSPRRSKPWGFRHGLRR